MPFVKVLIHYIWATKNREPIITPDLKELLLPHIRQNCIEKGIMLDTLNCVEDHIHLLIYLDTEQSISTIAKLIKGESSFWINNNNLVDGKFSWQDDYISLSVSIQQRCSNSLQRNEYLTFRTSSG